MKYPTLLFFSVSLLASLSAVAEAANPSVMFNKASVVGLENSIYADSVPVTDVDGKVIYWDINIVFTPDDSGAIVPTATVVSEASPKVSGKAPKAGRYTIKSGNSSGYIDYCDVTTAALANGRTQASFACFNHYWNYSFELSAVTGNVNASHPYYTQLKAAGIDKRGDVGNYIWGIATSRNGSYLGACGAYDVNDPIGVQQVNNTIVVSLFSNKGVLSCTSTVNLK
jgi:hypothetical protein